jgi:glycosyltransferase involved in cell wall biosynthesis
MIMRNEADNRLRQMLENARKYITDAVIIDDASTDNSVAICEEVLADIPHLIIKNSASKFHNEIEIRTQQWEETIQTNPDWILFLDADEIFEDSFANSVHLLISNPCIDAYYFRLYDFWDEEHYRQGPYWNAHQGHRPFLVRYRPDIPHMWLNQGAQHCGRMPTSCTKIVGVLSNYRLKHYGWATAALREAKFARYAKLDPEAKHGIKEQYDSILDPAPTLVKWVE